MSTSQTLKERVCEIIDEHAGEIEQIGDLILKNPETGFKEVRTAGLVSERMKELGLDPQTGLALTGVKGSLSCGKPGPRIAIIGELDSQRTPDHPYADRKTGAAHSCGHNAQIAALLGAAIAFARSGIAEKLSGEIVFFAVPAEEFIEVEERLQFAEEGRIELLLGKPELVAKGHFDGIDMAMMIHIDSASKQRSFMCSSSNGALIKQIRFFGKAAHAGTAPQLGINALNAANLALHAIALQRETFWDQDTVRIHPIITRGGDAVSVVPAEVTMETFVRGGSLDAIADASAKVDRSLRAGAIAIGAQVEIRTIPGFLPQRNDLSMGAIFGENVQRIFGPGQFLMGGHRTGSTDMGDLGHLMPVIHPYVVAATGAIHGSDWQLTNPRDAYIIPAKLLAMTVIDLLAEEGAKAREVLAAYTPAMTKTEYLAYQRRMFSTVRFSA